ncbi:MAG: sugar ABC transporter permease [Christensenellaceae bacterium]|nr:sugar ABC transporter permease [Christensenellaceae bacterium]MDD7186727.1 sugar ABC transporter permease [Clostridia bacterium]MDY2850555.1 sugar ABC transporter permease [Christensenellaceae bacterium]
MTENKKTLWRRIVKNKWAYAFILPLMIGAVGFCYYPAISGIVTSLFKWNGTGTKEFIGFSNYVELFRDDIFVNSIGTMFVLLVPRLLIGIFMPLIMAELIFNTKSKKMQSFYRIAVLLPMVAPGVVGMLIWQNIFEPTTGLYAKLLVFLGICEEGATIDFLNDPNWVISTIIILGFPWVNGTNILIYISGMMSISGEVIEASELDGCGTWRRIFTIDFPLLLGQIRYFAVFGFIGLMQDYGLQMILTNGGPGYTTYVPGWYMYKLAFTSGRYGYACSIGTILFIAIFAVTLVAFKLMHYGPFAKQSDM